MLRFELNDPAYEFKKPQYMACDFPISSKNKIKMPLLNRSHASLIIGPPRSGKSSFVSNLFKKDPKIYKQAFRNIIYACPPSSRSSAQGHPFNDIPEDHIFDNFDGFEIMDLVEKNRKKYGDNPYSQLLVIDDCSASLKKHEEVLSHLLLNRRHLNLTIFILAQYLVHIPLSLRTNVDSIVAFKLSGKEMEKLRNEFTQLNRREMKQLIHFVWGNNKGRTHEYLVIHPDLDEYYKGMSKIEIK